MSAPGTQVATCTCTIAVHDPWDAVKLPSYTVNHCPLHEAAEKLREALVELLKETRDNPPGLGFWPAIRERMDDADRALAAAKGQAS